MQNESLISFGLKKLFKLMRYVIKICHLGPQYFPPKCPQNAGNAISETQVKKFSGGECPRTPLKMCHHKNVTLGFD